MSYGTLRQPSLVCLCCPPGCSAVAQPSFCPDFGTRRQTLMTRTRTSGEQARRPPGSSLAWPANSAAGCQVANLKIPAAIHSGFVGSSGPPLPLAQDLRILSSLSSEAYSGLTTVVICIRSKRPGGRVAVCSFPHVLNSIPRNHTSQ
jgi:hypothetical protein